VVLRNLSWCFARILDRVAVVVAYVSGTALLVLAVAHAGQSLVLAVGASALVEADRNESAGAPVSKTVVLDSVSWEEMSYSGPPRKVEQPAGKGTPPTSLKGSSATSAQPANGYPTTYGGSFWGAFNQQPVEMAPATPQSIATYRTLCVRLCDGYYFPVSYATTSGHFAEDEAKCAASCGSPVKLYVHRNPGGEPEEMKDRSGQPYSELKTAFLYRTEYVPSCSCKAAAWEAEAESRHRTYALEAARAEIATKIASASRRSGKGRGKHRNVTAATPVDIAAYKASLEELSAEIAQLKSEVAAKAAAREEAARDMVVAKGIEVPHTGKKQTVAVKRNVPSETVEGAPLAMAEPAPPQSGPPPASWGAPMSLGASKHQPKIWGNGPNTRPPPRGRAAADDVFRNNFY